MQGWGSLIEIHLKSRGAALDYDLLVVPRTANSALISTFGRPAMSTSKMAAFKDKKFDDLKQI